MSALKAASLGKLKRKGARTALVTDFAMIDDLLPAIAPKPGLLEFKTAEPVSDKPQRFTLDLGDGGAFGFMGTVVSSERRVAIRIEGHVDYIEKKKRKRARKAK